MSNELARDVVGATLFGKGATPDIRERIIQETGGGTSRGTAPERTATRPTSGTTILGSNASAQRRAAGASDDTVPTMQKTLLGQ